MALNCECILQAKKNPYISWWNIKFLLSILFIIPIHVSNYLLYKYINIFVIFECFVSYVGGSKTIENHPNTCYSEILNGSG